MKQFFLWIGILICCMQVQAHPMPGSVVNLSLFDNYVRGEAKIPLEELGNAIGNHAITNIDNIFFRNYFTQHISATSNKTDWKTEIKSLSVISGTDAVVGDYKEADVLFILTPTDSRYLRTFSFNYDAVIHQVITHSALVYVSGDWQNGIQNENSAQQVGIIKLDIATQKIYPLEINVQQGSWWRGFTGMVSLGMRHIKEGTDHLLFLIVLLLPAMLLTDGKKWGAFGGVRYSLSSLLKIITAFTIGHSVTLIAGAMGWLSLPAPFIEILIAFSILISAVHALRPIFPGKEIFIAAGFGLIHGLAFAGVLANLDLSPHKLALSIFGFNLGIEIMQLFVIAIIVPWLILLSKTPIYKSVRVTAAVLAMIAASGWLAERVTGKTNFISKMVEPTLFYDLWIITALAGISLIAFIAYRPAIRNGVYVS